MAQIQSAYAGFNIILSLDGGELLGGFSEVSGMDIEMTITDYRSGHNDLVRTIPCSNRCFTITLRRGLVNATSLGAWIPQGIGGPSAQRNLSIVLLDEDGNVVQSWLLTGVVPMKYTGSGLAAEGDGDVAIEELVLTASALEMGG